MSIQDNNKTDNHNPTEAKIIEAAKYLFIQKGYAETSMSDIAARAGINRPALHYYFRTKDKMFHAVIGDIVSAIIPKVYKLLTKKEMPIANRIGGMIDAYYSLFIQIPRLPMFIIREINRDADMLISTIIQMHLNVKAQNVINCIQEEMNCGKLNKVPIRFFFCSFYGLLVTPLLMQDVIRAVMLEDGETFEQMLQKWKPYLLRQILALLLPPQEFVKVLGGI